MTAPAPPTRVELAVTPNGTVFDYTDKSIAIIRVPVTLWEQLANMNGMLSTTLTGLPERLTWMFSKKKLSAVLTLLRNAQPTVTPTAAVPVVPVTVVQADPVVLAPPAPEPTTTAGSKKKETPSVTTLQVRKMLSAIKGRFEDDSEYEGHYIKSVIGELEGEFLKGK